jgi:YVTN family beta-propeller protein
VTALACGALCSAVEGADALRIARLRTSGVAWATSRGPDTVTAFDGRSGKILATVPVGKAPMGVAIPPRTNKLYVGNEGSNSVSVISLKRRDVIATIDVGSRPHHMFASPDGNRVYVAEFGTNKIGVIDTMTDTLEVEWPTGPANERTHAPAPAPDGKTVYAVNSVGNDLVALDARTGAVEWSMPTGENPSEFHVLRDNRTGFLSVRNEDEIDQIDLAARKVVREIPVGDQPDTVQIAPDQRFLVVALRATPAEVDVVNLKTYAVDKIVFAGVRVAGHNWLSANGRYTFVSLDDPGGVGVIDHRTNAIVAKWTYPGGGSVHGMFYDDPRATRPGISILSRQIRVGGRDVTHVRVGCSAETAIFCKGRLRLATATRQIGAAGFALHAGASARVSVRLELQSLRLESPLSIRATATAYDILGHRSRFSRTIVLRIAAH